MRRELRTSSKEVHRFHHESLILLEIAISAQLMGAIGTRNVNDTTRTSARTL